MLIMAPDIQPMFLPEVWPVSAIEHYNPAHSTTLGDAWRLVRDALIPNAPLSLPSTMGMANLFRAIQSGQSAELAVGRLIVFKCPRHRPPGKQLLNPVFMMWGFDSNASARSDQYVRDILAGHDFSDDNPSLLDPNPADPWKCHETGGLLEQLLASGRDVCMLIPDDATRELQSTALLMLSALNTVFAQSEHGVAIPVIGFSAGGMISRWALLHLEDSRKAGRNLYPDIGQISAYLSYDTPHYGANVPLSIQMFLNFLADKLPAVYLLSQEAMTALRSINSPAACQLAWYHYGGVNPWGAHDVGPHPLRQLLLEELADRWPEGIPRYAYANGPANWHLFEGAMPGKPMIQVGDEYRLPLTPHFIPPIFNKGDGLQFNTLPDPNSGKGIDVFTVGKPSLRLYWGWVNRAEPIDSAPGSRTGFYDMTVKALNYVLEKRLLNVVPSITDILSYHMTLPLPNPPQSCFVPTVSALHLSTSVWYDCVHNLVGRDHMQPPFQRWQCAPDGVHERHVQVTDASARFVLSCIS